MTKAEFQHAVGERLHTLSAKQRICPDPKVGTNVDSRHLVTCKRLEKRTRHDYLRNTVASTLRAAHFAAAVRPEAILKIIAKYNLKDNLTEKQKQDAPELMSDIAIPNFRYDPVTKQARTAFVDVTVATPDNDFKTLTDTSQKIPAGAAAAKAEREKDKKYSVFVSPGPENCIPFAVESAGYVSAKGLAFIDEIADRLHPNENEESTKLSYNAVQFRFECFQKLSIALRKGQAALYYEGLALHTKDSAEYKRKSEQANQAKRRDHSDLQPASRRVKAKPKPRANKAKPSTKGVTVPTNAPVATRQSPRLSTRTGTTAGLSA